MAPAAIHLPEILTARTIYVDPLHGQPVGKIDRKDSPFKSVVDAAADAAQQTPTASNPVLIVLTPGRHQSRASGAGSDDRLDLANDVHLWTPYRGVQLATAVSLVTQGTAIRPGNRSVVGGFELILNGSGYQAAIGAQFGTGQALATGTAYIYDLLVTGADTDLIYIGFFSNPTYEIYRLRGQSKWDWCKLVGAGTVRLYDSWVEIVGPSAVDDAIGRGLSIDAGLVEMRGGRIKVGSQVKNLGVELGASFHGYGVEFDVAGGDGDTFELASQGFGVEECLLYGCFRRDGNPLRNDPANSATPVYRHGNSYIEEINNSTLQIDGLKVGQHYHNSQDIIDASMAPDAQKVALYDDQGDLTGNTVHGGIMSSNTFKGVGDGSGMSITPAGATTPGGTCAQSGMSGGRGGDNPGALGGRGGDYRLSGGDGGDGDTSGDGGDLLLEFGAAGQEDSVAGLSGNIYVNKARGVGKFITRATGSSTTANDNFWHVDASAKRIGFKKVPAVEFDIGGVAAFSSTVRLGNFAVASLPTAGTAGRTAFATNGRKVGQGVGAGTGVPVYDDGVAWRRYSDDTTVLA